MSNRCIGIDLGTTNSCIGVWENDGVTIIKNEFGQSTTPSVVHYPKTGDPTVGRNAQAKLARAPNRTIYAVKRLIGKRFSKMCIRDRGTSVPLNPLARGTLSP